MKRNAIAVLSSLVSLLMLGSCSKFSNGEPVSEQRSLDHRFETISMYHNVNVRLVHDSHPRVELTCPKNLIEKVTTEVMGDTLYIKNENDLNWLRSFDYSIDMTVYYDSLREIDFASNGHLFCTDSLKGMWEMTIDTVEDIIDTLYTRNLLLRVKEGSGPIDLTIDCDVLKDYFINGTADINLRGRANYAEHISRSYGPIHAEALNTNLVKVQSRSTNDIYVWARTELSATLYSIGNVYYKGHPWIDEHCLGEGRVVKLE